MKRVFIALLLIFPSLIHSQTLSLKLGGISQMSGQISFSYFAGTGANHYYYAQMPNVGKMELLAYDLSHKLTGKSPMELDVAGKKAGIEEIISTRNNSYALSTCNDKKENKSYAFLHKISPDGKIESAGIPILVNNKNISIGSNRLVFTPFGDNDNTGLFISPDSALMTYIESSSENQNSKAERLGIVVVDENLTKKWEREVVFKYNDNVATVKHTFLTTDGRVIVTAWIHDTKDYRHKKIVFNRIKLFVIDKNDMKEIDCDFSSEIAPTDAVVTSSAGNEIIVCGTYDVAYDCTGGAYVLKADIETGKIIAYKTQPIKMEDLDFGKAKGQLKKEKGVEDEHLVSAIQLKDGSNIITIAQSLSSEHATQSYDKIIFAFDKDLNPKYSFGIKGWTSATPDASVLTTPLNDGYVVIYLDNDSRGNLLAVYVNAKGEKGVAQSFPIGKMYFKPYNSQKLDDKRILIEGEAFGNYQFGILSLK